MLIHVDGKKHVLEIKEVTLDDTCQIKAEAKGIPSMANLTVIGNPRISAVLFLVLPVSLLLIPHCYLSLSMFVLLCICKTFSVFFVVRNCFSMLCICVPCCPLFALYHIYVLYLYHG